MSVTPPRSYSGKAVVLWLIVGMLLMLLVFYWVFRRGLQISAADQQRSRSLSTGISTDTGTMRLVTAGKFMAGEDPVPVNLPAFYINAEPARTGLPFTEAKRFCQGAGQRLPTPIEWEKAFPESTPRAEWVDDAHVPKQFELRAFQEALTPPASLSEEWSTLRGGPTMKRTASMSAPSRYASSSIATLCALTPDPEKARDK